MDRMGRRIDERQSDRRGVFFFRRPGRRGLACGVISRREFERGGRCARARECATARLRRPSQALQGLGGAGTAGAAARACARGGEGRAWGGRGVREARAAPSAEREARRFELSGWLKVGRAVRSGRHSRPAGWTLPGGAARRGACRRCEGGERPRSPGRRRARPLAVRRVRLLDGDLNEEHNASHWSGCWW